MDLTDKQNRFGVKALTRKLEGPYLDGDGKHVPHPFLMPERDARKVASKHGGMAVEFLPREPGSPAPIGR